MTHETTSKGGKSLGYTYNAKGQLGSVDHNGFKYNYAYDAFGNTMSVKVNNQPLVTYGYQPNNGKLNSTTYGNGSKETYTYNAYGEMTKKSQAGVGTFTYIHDTQGRKYYETDSAGNLKTYYTYDDKGRLANEKVFTNESNVLYNDKYSVSYNYDNEGRVTKNTLRSRPASISSTFSYDENGNNNVNALTSVRSIQFAYDADKRMTGRTLNLDTPIAETFTYNEDESIGTHQINNNVYAYTYDDNGNITEIKKNNAIIQSFVYDEDNQLIRDNNVETNKTTVYSYDNAGNIANKKEYAYTTGDVGAETSTVNYAYDETWKDKLTSYNGESISYDSIGNPTTYRGATATWFGRQMQSYTKGNNTITYKYDSDGLRTKKIVNGVTYEYYYVDGQLAYEKKGDEYELFYRYDADGRLAMVVKNRLSDNYKSYCYVVTNTRGDVLELHNGPGDLIAKYTYDAWGKLISVTNAAGNALAKTNLAYQISVRYRSYVYDEETGLYYLQSRYYDPETGRFLNADDVEYIGYDGTVLSYNSFAYCENEPVNRYDPSGFTYSPTKAKKYADKWWYCRNPEYKKNKYDCANFVSQCLYAGGLSKMTGASSWGWHHYNISGAFQISNAWGKAADLYNWLLKNHCSSSKIIRGTKDDKIKLLYKYSNNIQKNYKYCTYAIFYDWTNNGSIDHATLSGQMYKSKNNYDIYYYAHSSDRAGWKRRYEENRFTNNPGKQYTVAQAIRDNPRCVVYFIKIK